MDYCKLVTRHIRLSFLLLIALLLNSCINLPPVPNAGEFQTGSVGDTIYVSAEKSWDINGSELSFNWHFYSKPQDSDASLLRPDSMEAEFIADTAGEYIVKVEVNDGKYTTYDYVTIYINDDNIALEDHPPVSDSCISCHNGINATEKNENHINSTDKCDACHSLKQWQPIIVVNHTETVGSCDACHNGTLSMGKNTSHLLTTDKCNACHGVSQWIPALIVDHTEAVGKCISCHNGSAASTMSINHIQVKNDCSDCHNSNSWRTTGKQEG